MNDHWFFECTGCGAFYRDEPFLYLCPVCAGTQRPGHPPAGVLKVHYDYNALSIRYRGRSGFDRLEAERFLPLLPLRSMDAWPPLRIGQTPIYSYDGPEGGCYLKDDSQNPTFSFKDRASALVSAWAKEQGITRLVAASTGNAGSSLAGICAAQHQQALIIVPATAPHAKLAQVLMYGATLIPVKGSYDDAFDLSVQLTEKYGWFNRNTAYNPFTIEGKKTVAFELFKDLRYRVPDRIFVPTGDGVIISGVYKGFEELMKIGITDRMPVMVAVQSSGSPNMADNLFSESFIVHPSRTIADSISVDIPRNFHMTRRYMTRYQGEALVITDQEILEASLHLSRHTGIFTEPASAAAYGGFRKHRRENGIAKDSLNVVLLTGSGLKDTAAVSAILAIPDPVQCDIQALTTFDLNLS